MVQMVEEENEEEEVLYSCGMIIVDVDYWERSGEIKQDNHTRSNTRISTYGHLEDKRGSLLKHEILIGEMRGSICAQVCIPVARVDK